MRRASFGAVLGENRLMRTYDALGWSTWGWTPVLGLDVSGIQEVIATFGENVIALCDLNGGGQAIYHAPDSGETWAKVLEVDEIYDITSVGYNWTLASTSDGWYSSMTSGSTWELIAAAGAGVPVGKSVVWVAPNHLFAHDGSAIWLSEDRGATWTQVCDLTTITGYLATKYNSIDGYQGRIIATCGYALVESLDLGETWTPLGLSSVIRDWAFVSATQPIWRQIAFWDTLDASDPTKSRWMISCILGTSSVIRTYINRGTGIFAPAVDMGLSERHRLNVSSTRRMGADITDLTLMISGDRRITTELRHAIVTSSDGVTFKDLLGGTSGSAATSSNATLDKAHAALSKLAVS